MACAAHESARAFQLANHNIDCSVQRPINSKLCASGFVVQCAQVSRAPQPKAQQHE